MDASVSVTAAPLPPQPRRRHAHNKQKVSHDARLQLASLQGKQKPRKARSKSVSKLAIADSTAVVADYHDALWYNAGKGDLVFAHWLLGRCNGVGDATTPQSAEAVQRMFALYQIQCKLRQELSRSSKREVIEGAEEEENDDDADACLWSVEEIVEQATNVLRVSRLELMKQQKAAEKSNAKRRKTVERIVVTEVVENATELILSRATNGHEVVLRRWIEVLRDEEHVEADPTIGSVRKKREARMRVRKNATKGAEELVCEQVESFLTFLAESAQTPTLSTAYVTTVPSDAEKAWSMELQQIVESSSIGPQEEKRRLQVARDIQTVFRREVSQWRHCDVVLYGSSLTHYGSLGSDLDMCLLPNGRSSIKYVGPSVEAIGKRELQRLIGGSPGESEHTRSDAGGVYQLPEIGALVRTGIEKLTQALNELDRVGSTCDKVAKQRCSLEFFHCQMRMLHNAIVAELSNLPEDAIASKGAPAHLKAVIAASKRRTNDLYRVREILQRLVGCEVRHVIAGARVPIIRFLHKSSGCEYECDLCFENVLATHNTPLLRAYASFDDRARSLGLAVKHWVKRRGISDASMGFLSSYSFVLLSIFYLQVVRVLPNLQDPRLLEYAHVEPDYVNGVNIAFCKDRDLAQRHHELTLASDVSGVSLATLLVGFFEFYATQFDFAKRVVTVRSPETPVLKLQQWGSRKAKTWRLSIQDPLETGRDLGCVLQYKGQERIICELRRAHGLLVQGGSFIDDVCAVDKPADKAVKAGKAKQKNGTAAPVNGVQSERSQRQADVTKRSFSLSLESADEKLTKEEIEQLFKDFQASVSVGKVVEATSFDSTAGDGHDVESSGKQWEVELWTQAKKLPRRLYRTTRIDWETEDGRGGRVWVHHQTYFATPPCRQCLSPKHATSKCSATGGREDNNSEGAGDRAQQVDKSAAERNARRHVLHLALSSGQQAAVVKLSGHRKEQQQHGGASQQVNSGAKSEPGNIRRVNEVGKKKVRGNMKTEAEQVAGSVLIDSVDGRVPVVTSVRGDGEGDTGGNMIQKKKKKRQQRVYRKRGTLKEGQE
ncbi:unnamed protein product [Hyaloperonospora brassicae]|uniref:PAP-associated domain-containing protein n=1 Tax=Hyaloperonospora brassicae TaxID=162125 RepID=A0AAV0SYH6_HYABA|nr:unnamed protein product [Hyaloperonospora brassicae]